MSKILATPAARVAAKERNIDLSQVKGTGQYGAVVLKDLENVAAVAAAPAERGVKITPVAKNAMKYYNVSADDVANDGVKIKKQDVLNAVSQPAAAPAAEAPAAEATPAREVTRTPLKGMRKAIADNVMNNLQTMAQNTYMAEIETDKFVEFFLKVKASYKNAGRRLTMTDMYIKFITMVLQKMPMFNQQCVGNEILSYPYVNMGLAVSVPAGLVVPVINGTDTMTLSEICDARTEIVEKARNNKLKPSEMQGATFTISNLGNGPVKFFVPIINSPEVAILGINRTEDKLYLDEEGNVKTKKVTYFSITCDHRIIDGMDAANFMVTLQELMNDPYQILL